MGTRVVVGWAWTVRRFGVVGLMTFGALGGAGPAHAGTVPGYREQDGRTLVPGVEYRRLVRPEGPVVAHVVTMKRDAGGVALRAVLSNDRVAGPAPAQERTSAMCQRVRCIAAVNGDFALPSGEPLGGVVSAGQMLRSPVPTQHQLSVTSDGALVAGTLAWSAQLVPSDLRPLAVHGLNVDRPSDAIVLYTPAYGPTTGTNDYGAELLLRLVESPSLRLGETALVELAGLATGRGNAAIPSDGLVLSGHGAGAAAVVDLWNRHQAGTVGRRGLLRTETAGPVVESVGGTPILVHQGRRWVADDGSNFVAGRHPRTVVGWNDREVLLVTVDGRQPGYSVGQSLLETADLMAALGATEALNLDGGGSTTLAVGPTVVNRPSDHLVRRGRKEQVVHEPRAGDAVVGVVERPVASGLAIVPRGPLASGPVDPFRQGPRAVLPDLAPPPSGSDPASVPGAGNLALLRLPVLPAPGPGLIAVAAGIEVAVAQWLVVVMVKLRRRRPSAA